MKKSILLVSIAFVLTEMYSQEYPPPNLDRPKKLELYNSYDEFRTGQTTRYEPYYIDSVRRESKNWDETYSFTPRYRHNYKSVKGLWGFCDGRYYYIYFHEWSEFFRIRTGDEFLSIVAYGNMGWVGPVVGGITGSAIGGDIGGFTGMVAGGAISNTVLKTRTYEYFIGPYTGALYTDEGSMIQHEAKFKFTHIIFYRLEKDEIPEEINIKVSDSLFYTFPPSSYKVLRLRMSFDPVRITYGEDYSKQLEIYLTAKDHTYIRIMQAKKQDEPEVVQVDQEEGSFYSFKARKKQQKRKKKIAKSEGGN
jgi:hypothetical protein